MVINNSHMAYLLAGSTKHPRNQLHHQSITPSIFENIKIWYLILC